MNLYFSHFFPVVLYVTFFITFNPNKEGLLTYLYGNKNLLQRSKCILDGYHIYD